MMPTCTPNPCLNGGICSLLAAGTIVSCTCPTGYTGTTCQTEISELTVGMNENTVQTSCCEHSHEICPDLGVYIYIEWSM